MKESGANVIYWVRTSFRLLMIAIFAFVGEIGYAEVDYSQRRNLVTESNGLYGFHYKGLVTVLPQYEKTMPVGDNRPCFLAKSEGKWGLRDIYNRPIIPFIFSDVQTMASNENKSYDTVLDSIYVADMGTVLSRVSVTSSVGDSKFKDSTPPILVVKQSMPSGIGEGWTFVNFEGKPITSQYYDEAYCFSKVSIKRKSVYLAAVKRNGLWGAIDLNGVEVVPMKNKGPVNAKNKYVQKILRKDFSESDKEKIRALEALIPAEGQSTVFWHIDSVPQLKVIKHGGTLIKNNKKAKTRKNAPKKYTPVTYTLSLNGKSVIDDAFEEVGEQQNDMIRVKKNGRWGLYSIGAGMFLPCDFDSISKFDQFGLAKCYMGGEEFVVSAYAACSTFGPDIEEIYQRANQVYGNTKSLDETGPIFEELLTALDLYGDDRLRLAYQSKQMNDYFLAKREREDPVYAEEMHQIREEKRMEEERAKQAREAEKAKKKSNGGFWGLIGSLASAAGEIIEVTGTGERAETGSSLAYIGKTITAVSKGEAIPTEEEVKKSKIIVDDTDEEQTVSSNNSQADRSQLEADLAYLDAAIKENERKRAVLARNRVTQHEKNLLAKKDSRSSSRINKFDTGKRTGHINKNGSPTVRANAGQKKIEETGRELAKTDKELDRLTAQWRKLVKQRQQVSAKLNSLLDDEELAAKKKASSTDTQESLQREYDGEAHCAEIAFRAITVGGTVKRSGGKIVEGTGENNTSRAAIVSKLIKYQHAMKRIRKRAESKKFKIKVSEYETVKVRLVSDN